MAVAARRCAALLVGALLIAAAGCSADDTAPSGPSAGQAGVATVPAGDAGAFNPTDVMFLQMMVPHHRQGLAIAKVGASRAQRENVKLLAAAIDSTQAVEAEQMSGWLKQWGQPAEAKDDEHAAHGGMPGTTPEEIAKLDKLSGAQFDRAFLQMMLAHQDDAIQMARMELASGTNPLAKDLAGRIEKSRTAQLAQMVTFLDATPAP